MIHMSFVQGGASVDDFLTSLDLEKYSITFQAEEVCKIMGIFQSPTCGKIFLTFDILIPHIYAG